jgi:acyl-CoA reductase-like NAD-dependent aldehyde dehydrogenase
MTNRINVLKTYKLYIDGQFPRTESGRYYKIEDKDKNTIANVCLSSRKDFRNAVVAARGAFGKWSELTAYNRSQIIYRIAEMMESRQQELVGELVKCGLEKAQAEKEVLAAIDRVVYYAGWCDKFGAVFSSVNPVASHYFNFSVLEPMGVVSIIAPEKDSFLALTTLVVSCIAGANTCIVLASEKSPLAAICFAEILHTSDLPAGVVNILTGSSKELHQHFASHMDVNSTISCIDDEAMNNALKISGVDNLKRIYIKNNLNWFNDNEAENPYLILDTQEVKTTWHPIENIGGAKSSY